ncbi:MAG: MATE family efflux transporter [Terrisporobacter sp.]
MITTLSNSTNNNFKNQFFKYVIPSVASMWVSALYVMVDAMFVSKGVGPNALAAVNIAMPYTNFIFGLSVLFSVGASTVISIKLGEKDHTKAKKYFSMTIFSLVIISLFICVMSLLFLDQIVLFLGATDSVFPMVKDYLKIIIIFIVFYIVSYAFEVLIKTDGYPHLSTIGVIISALTNIILDYVFVIKFNWGVEGAAFATGLARAFSFVFFLIHFLGNKSKLKFCKFKFNFSILKRIASIGFADCATELSIGVVILLFNQIIIKYLGEGALVSYSVVSYVNTLVLSTMLGISQGLQPLSSYYYGTGDCATVKSLLKLSLKYVMISSLVVFLVCIFFTDYIVLMFIDKSDMALFEYTVSKFRLFSISFLILGFNVVISGFLSSLEKTLDACKISLSRGLFVISISLFVTVLAFGGNGIWFSTIISECVVLVLSLITLKHALKDMDLYSDESNTEIAMTV